MSDIIPGCRERTNFITFEVVMEKRLVKLMRIEQ